LMCFTHVSLLSRCMPRYFTSFLWARSILPICTVGQFNTKSVNPQSNTIKKYYTVQNCLHCMLELCRSVK
jgi:hypothetical protein